MQKNQSNQCGLTLICAQADTSSKMQWSKIREIRQGRHSCKRLAEETVTWFCNMTSSLQCNTTCPGQDAKHTILSWYWDNSATQTVLLCYRDNTARTKLCAVSGTIIRHTRCPATAKMQHINFYQAYFTTKIVDRSMIHTNHSIESF